MVSFKDVKGADVLSHFSIVKKEKVNENEFDDFTPPVINDIGDLKLPPKEKRELIDDQFDGYKREWGPKISGSVERLIDALRVRSGSLFFQTAQETIGKIDNWINAEVMGIKVKPIYKRFNIVTYVKAVSSFYRLEYGKRILETELPPRMLNFGFLAKENSKRSGPERFQAGDFNYVLAPEFFGDPKAKQLIKDFSALLFKVRNPESVIQNADDLKRIVGDNPLALAQLKNQENGKMILDVPKYHIVRNDNMCLGGQAAIEVIDGRIYLLASLGAIKTAGWQIIDQEIWIPSNQISMNAGLDHGTKVNFNLGYAKIFQQWIKESVRSLQNDLDRAELAERNRVRVGTELEELQAELKKKGQSVLDDVQFWLEKKGGFYLLEYSKFGQGVLNLDGHSYPDLYFLIHRKLKKKGNEKQEFVDVFAHPERLDEILLSYQTPVFTGSENFQNSVLGVILKAGYAWAKSKAEAGELKVAEVKEETTVSVEEGQLIQSDDGSADPKPE